ncbi:hypothetical protein HDU92_003713 [Lobulomyces angularis]|nr:hypothetical protein HDU92_003713 [Lobulomyces angularis]
MDKVSIDKTLVQMYGTTRPTWTLKNKIVLTLLKKVLAVPQTGADVVAAKKKMAKGLGININFMPKGVVLETINVKRLEEVNERVGLKYSGEIKADWIEVQPRKKTKDETIVLYLHGGGYVMGSRHTHRNITGKISKLFQASVLVPDYGLAPEEPFPIGIYDAVSSYFYLLEQYRPEQIFVMGDSAGGGLSLGMMLWLRDHPKYPMPGGVIGLSPYVDLYSTHPSFILNRPFDYLTALIGNEFTERDKKLTKERNFMYCENNEDAHHHYASPIFYRHKKDDFEALPPILIQYGDSELLRDECITLYSKTFPTAKVRLEGYEDQIHVFQMLPFNSLSGVAMTQVLDFITEVKNLKNLNKLHEFKRTSIEFLNGGSKKVLNNPYSIVENGNKVIEELRAKNLLIHFDKIRKSLPDDVFIGKPFLE